MFYDYDYKSRQPLTSQSLYSGVVGVVSVVSYVLPCCDCVLWYICSALDIVRALCYWLYTLLLFSLVICICLIASPSH